MLTRLKQSALEKTGKGTVTVYEPHFSELVKAADDAKTSTDSLINKLKSHLVGYGEGKGNKIEQMAVTATTYATVISREGPKLSQGMTQMSKAYHTIANAEKEYQSKVELEVLTPLRSWLKDYYYNFNRQRDLLKKKRQEMDGLATKVSSKPDDLQARVQLDSAVEAHKAQYDVVKEVLTGLHLHLEEHRKIFGKLLNHQQTLHNETIRALTASMPPFNSP